MAISVENYVLTKVLRTVNISDGAGSVPFAFTKGNFVV